MINVFVCEDDYKLLNVIANYINNYLMIENLDMKLALATGDPHAILNYLDKNDVDRSLYFLDIDLGSDIDGIELARDIRKKKLNSKIVFITSHSEMVFLTFKYQIESLDYILKDYPDEMQARIIKDIQTSNREFKQKSESSEEYYQFKTGEHVRSVRISDILFFESSPVPHKVKVHLINGQFEFYSTVKKLEDENKAFFRCYKSYVVNVNNIKSINRHTREITMIDGEVIISSVMACRTLINVFKK